MPRQIEYKFGDARSPEVIEFLKDIIAVQRKHNLYLGHEDHHGAFEVVHTSAGVPELYEDWLMNAHEKLTIEVSPEKFTNVIQASPLHGEAGQGDTEDTINDTY